MIESTSFTNIYKFQLFTIVKILIDSNPCPPPLVLLLLVLLHVQHDLPFPGFGRFRPVTFPERTEKEKVIKSGSQSYKAFFLAGKACRVI